MFKKTAQRVLIIIFSITAVLSIFLKDLRFNYVFEDFFPIGDPDLEYYREFRSLFENDNDYLLIGLKNHPSIFETAFLQRVDSLTQDLQGLEEIKSAISITDTKRLIISQAGIYQLPYLYIDQPARYAQDSAVIYQSALLSETLVSKDGKALAIIIKHEDISTKEESDGLANKIVSLVRSYAFDSYHLAGKVHAQQVFINKLQVELVTFLSASIILIVLFLAFAYRNWWGVIIPLGVVFMSVLWIMGLMGVTGKQLDFIMVLLPTIMFVVGMSDVVHIMTKYIEQLRLGFHKISAIKTTFREVGLATFLTSLTTSVGFLTLLTASIRPIQGFGLFTSIGVFIAFIVAFTLLPCSLLLLPRPQVSRKLVHRSKWFGILSFLFIRTLKNGWSVILINAVIVLVSLYGISLIRINTFLIEDLPQDDPLKQDFLFFDQNFGGSRPFEITVEAKKGSVLSEEVISEIDRLSSYLSDSLEAGNIIGPHTLVKSINQAINGGRSDAFTLPSSDYEKKQVKKNLSRVLKRNEHANIVLSQDQKTGRISMRVGDIGSAISLERTERLKEYIERHTDSSLTRFKITGTSNLIDKNNVYLAENMFEGLGIAFAVVAFIAGLLFRSLRMVLIALIPNVIPLVTVAGIMGIFGITLKLSTSIVFTIAFGIAVDDTIHFTSKLKLELDKGKSLLYALKNTYLSTGKAILVTSIILSGGFLTLLLSSFGGTFYTGLLISLTLFIAVVIDLSLLPVLIMFFYKTKKQKV